jgi:hypothetical protein
MLTFEEQEERRRREKIIAKTTILLVVIAGMFIIIAGMLTQKQQVKKPIEGDLGAVALGSDDLDKVICTDRYGQEQIYFIPIPAGVQDKVIYSKDFCLKTSDMR